MQNLDKIDLGLICVAKLFIVQFKVLAIFMPSKSRATSCACWKYRKNCAPSGISPYLNEK